MNVQITARHFELGSDLKEYVETRVQDFKKHFNQIIDVLVVLNIEKHRHLAEITLHASGSTFSSKTVSDDMYISIDQAVTKIERQLQKYKEKLKHHKERKHMGEIFVSVPIEDETFLEYDIDREKHDVKPLLIEEAIEQMNALNKEIVLFNNVLTGQTNVIYKKGDKYGLVEPAE